MTVCSPIRGFFQICLVFLVGNIFFSDLSAFFSGSSAWSVGETLKVSDLGFINSDVLFQLFATGGLRWSRMELFVSVGFLFSSELVPVAARGGMLALPL